MKFDNSRYPLDIKEMRIKSVPWVYSCYEEYLEEFDKRKILKYSLLLAKLSILNSEVKCHYRSKVLLAQYFIKMSHTNLL